MTSVVGQKTDLRRKVSPTNLSFRTTISEDSSNEHLQLPKNYVKKFQMKYKQKLPNNVHLKPPCGTEWPVEVTEHNDIFWFQKGWKELFKFYSFRPRHSLIFQYEGNSTFKVTIFDKTKAEIDYPVKTIMQENDMDEHVLPGSTPMPRKKEPAGSSEKVERGKSTQRSKEPTNGRKQSSTTTRNAKAPASARKLVSETCFYIKMQPTYVEGRSIWLQSEFSGYMTSLIENGGEIRLRVLGGRRKPWTVSVKYSKQIDMVKNRVSLCCGWRKFVQDNKLRVDDECFFTLIDKHELLFEVKIVRVRKAASKHSSSPDDDNSGDDKNCEIRDVDRDDENHSDNDANNSYVEVGEEHTEDSLVHKRKRSSSTTKNINDVSCGYTNTQKISKRRPHYPRGMYMGSILARGRPYIEVDKDLHAASLKLPIEFANQYLHGKTSQVKLHNQNSDRKPWIVKIYFGHKQAYFKDGWIEFVRGNFLQENAMCVFEMTDEREFEFDVHFLQI